MFSLTLSSGLAFIGNFKQIGNTLDDKYLTLVVGNLSSIANGCFRLIFGFLYDKYKF